MKRNFLFLLCSLLLLCLSFASGYRARAADIAYLPKEGCVPDTATAGKIAEAVWDRIYGKELINAEKPFHYRLRDGKVWEVGGYLATDALGGSAYIEIQKSDCKILKVYHEK